MVSKAQLPNKNGSGASQFEIYERTRPSPRYFAGAFVVKSWMKLIKSRLFFLSSQVSTGFCTLAVLMSLSIGAARFAMAEDPAVPAIPSDTNSSASQGASGAPAGGPAGLMQFAPFLLMFAVLYFLILRPQQKKMKEQQTMISALKHGDEVVTASGLLGKVTGITDKVVTLEVADNVRVKMLKNQVSQVIKGSIKDIAT